MPTSVEWGDSSDAAAVVSLVLARRVLVCLARISKIPTPTLSLDMLDNSRVIKTLKT